MFQTILVPVDGSSRAEHALPLAIALARAARAAVRLVTVHRLAAGSPAEDLAVEHVEQAYLDRTADGIRRAGVPTVSTDILEEGSIAPALCAYARAVDAALIALTTHGRGPLSRFWLGSVTDELLRTSPVPVLVVRAADGVRPDLAAPVGARRILVPLDGSETAAAALAPAVQLTRLFEAGLVLFRVVVPAPVAPADQTAPLTSAMEGPALDEMVRRAGEDLEQIARQLRAVGLAADTRVAVDVSPAAAVLDAALATDMIALSTHGRGRVARFLLGSVADKVVRGAPCPVFVVRSPSPNEGPH
jgi:nucleotide-binding universal stress UspA family protein